MLISLYKNSTDTKGVLIDHLKVLGGIKDGRWRDAIDKLRTLLEKGEEQNYSEAKRQLPSPVFGGTFTQRGASFIDTPSNMIVLDIDHLDGTQMDLYRSSFEVDPYVYSCFVSPSNAGFKLLVKYDANSHLQAFLSLEKYFKENYAVTLDSSGKDISRICYISYDPNLYLNEESAVFICDRSIQINTGTNSFGKRPERFKDYVLAKSAKDIYHVCVKWTERHHQYEQGNRNNYIHVLACNMNRAGVFKDDTLLMLYNAYADLDFKEIEQSVNSAYKNESEHNSIDVYSMNPEDLPEHHQETEMMTQQEETVYLDTLEFLKAKLKTNIISKYIKNFGVTFLGLNEENVKAIMNQAFNAFKQTKEESFELESADKAFLEAVNEFQDAGGVPTRIPEVDNALSGGLMPGCLYGAVGDGGSYKSIFAQCVATDMASEDGLVIYLSGEMSRLQMMDRVMNKELGIELLKGLKDKSITKDNATEFSVKLKEILKDNFQIVSTSGWNKNDILTIVSDIESKSNKKVRLIVVDGLSQCEDTKKDEIKSAIFNSGMLKEVAKETDSAVLVLAHVSSNPPKHLRDTSKLIRGSTKLINNMDAMFCFSLFIDESASNMSEGDYLYRSGIFYLRFIDKRGSGVTINKAIEVNRPLKLKVLDIDPQMMEVKTN